MQQQTNIPLAAAAAQLALASAHMVCASVGHPAGDVTNGDAALRLAEALRVVIREARAIPEDTRHKIKASVLAAAAEIMSHKTASADTMNAAELMALREQGAILTPADMDKVDAHARQTQAGRFDVISGGLDHA